MESDDPAVAKALLAKAHRRNEIAQINRDVYYVPSRYKWATRLGDGRTLFRQSRREAIDLWYTEHVKRVQVEVTTAELTGNTTPRRKYERYKIRPATLKPWTLRPAPSYSSSKILPRLCTRLRPNQRLPSPPGHRPSLPRTAMAAYSIVRRRTAGDRGPLPAHGESHRWNVMDNATRKARRSDSPSRLPGDFVLKADTIQQMVHLLEETGGLGLAAPQVGIDARLFVTVWGEVFVNPTIVRREGEVRCQEGCLSLPGVTRLKKRCRSVVLADGRIFEGEQAIVIQHETDHLDGILITDE